MNYVIRLHIFYSLDQLSDYHASFLLPYGAPLIKKVTQIKAVGIFLNHVDFRRSLDCLIMSDAIVTSNHTVDFNFFKNSLHLDVAEVLSVEYFTCKHCFAGIDG